MAEASSSNASTAVAPSRATLWPILQGSYEIKHQIGKGSTAIVQEAYNTVAQMKCAIKEIDLENCSGDKEFLQEIALMSKCNHPNIVGYYCCFVVKRKLWLVMSLMDAGSVLDYIKYHREKQKKSSDPVKECNFFTEQQISTILKESLKGLAYLHDQKHIHRDVKCGNILMSTTGTVKIADFGVSAMFNGMTRNNRRTTFVGTPCWMAPEVMDEKIPDYDAKADIWSFGITAIEMACGHPPYYDMQPMKVILMVIHEEINVNQYLTDQKIKVSKELKKVIELCLRRNPRDRPTSQQLLLDKFFKKTSYNSGIQTVQTMLQTIDKLADRIVPAKIVTSGSLRKNSRGQSFFLLDDSDDPGDDEPGPSNMEVDESAPVFAEPQAERVEISLTLRMRNNNGDLNDIRFSYCTPNDTPDGIARELVQAGLVKEVDVLLVSSNMTKVIESHSTRVFALTGTDTNFATEEDKTDLHGYAQISKNDS